MSIKLQLHSDCKKDVFASQQGPPLSHICTDHSSFGPGLALGLGPAGQSGPTVNKGTRTQQSNMRLRRSQFGKVSLDYLTLCPETQGPPGEK